MTEIQTYARFGSLTAKAFFAVKAQTARRWKRAAEGGYTVTLTGPVAAPSDRVGSNTVSAVFLPSDDALDAARLASTWQDGPVGAARHKVIASLGASQCLCLWDYETKACSLTLPLAERFHSGASAVGAGLGVVELSDRFLLYGKGTTVIVVDALTGHQRFTLRGHDSTVTCMKLFDNPFSAPVCATGSYDGTVCVWDLKHGLLVQRLSLPHPAAAEANDGHTAGTAIPVWSVAIIDTTAQLLSHQRRCEQLYGVFGLGHGVSPAAPPEVPGEGLEEGLTFTQRRERAETDARNLLLSRLWVCSGNRDGRLTMWNAVSGTPVFTVDLPVTQILSLHADYVSKRILAGCFDGNLYVIDTTAGTVIKTITVASGASILCCDVDWDCGIIACGYRDGAVLLWDFVSELASCVASFPQRHTGDVKCVCLRDGRLVSGGFDGSVRVTDVKPVEYGFVTAAGGLVASVADCVVQ